MNRKNVHTFIILICMVIAACGAEGANWSEAEAIAKAIEHQKPNEHIAVKSVEFDVESALWKIDFIELPIPSQS